MQTAIYLEGYKAAYYQTNKPCPYTGELAVDWYDGFQDGLNDRAEA